MIRYDATRSLAHVKFEGARGRRIEASADALADAWYLAHALIAGPRIALLPARQE